MIYFELDLNKPLSLSDSERDMLKKAAEMKPEYDEDSPPLTEEQLKKLYPVGKVMDVDELHKWHVESN